MDAALDAMSQYGFDQKIVCRTIKELLKVSALSFPLG